MRPKAGPTTRSPPPSTPDVKWYRSGASASLLIASRGWKSMLVRVVPGLFPPQLVVHVKALACELPAKYGRPAIPLEYHRPGATSPAERLARLHQWQYTLALVTRRRHSALVSAQLDLSTGPGVCDQGGARARFIRPGVARLRLERR